MEIEVQRIGENKSMIIRKIKLTDLQMAPYNPRKDLKPGDKDYEDIKQSILEFDYIDPIIWNERTDHVVGGNQRLKVLRDLGIEEAEVSVVDFPLEKEKLLNVALNKISGEWDKLKLKELITELETYPVDVTLSGFDKVEIEALLDPVIKEDNFDGAAEYEKILEPTTRRGDIYQLGRHRLMCGDSTSRDEIHILLDGHKANMVFTDPPYNVNYGATMKDALGYHNSKTAGRKILNDNFKTKEAFYEFLYNAIAAFRCQVSGDVYICMSSSELHTLQSAFADNGGHFSTFIIWVKNQFTIGRANYQRQYEPIIYGWFEGSSHYWSGVRNLGDVCGQQNIKRDDDGTPLVRVESYAIDSDIWEFAKPTVSKEHPTMKPIGLVARALRNSSRPGDLILDSFGGSGTTMMAAEQTDRCSCLMELDPKYCDVEIKRWELFTGEKAELITRG
jgi:DNA modification methylase